MIGVTRGCAGQAAVELVALLPVLAVVCMGAWQCVVAGHAVWATGGAARAAARAAAVGADARAAARAHLPAGLERGLRVRDRADGVEVSVRIPRVAGMPALGRVSARSAFADQGA